MESRALAARSGVNYLGPGPVPWGVSVELHGVFRNT